MLYRRPLTLNRFALTKIKSVAPLGFGKFRRRDRGVGLVDRDSQFGYSRFVLKFVQRNA